MGHNYSRLAKYDHRAATLARLTHRLSFVHWYLIGGILLGFVLSGGGLLFRSEVTAVSGIASSAIAIAATLGGLSTTIFFLTAQLKVGGISQYGLTELYRVQDHLPLMVTTISAIIFGFVSLSAVPCNGANLQACPARTSVAWLNPVVFDLHRQSAMLALLAVGLLMCMSIVLGLTLISNLEPVTVARRYAMRVKPGDALEWGLFTVDFSTTTGQETDIVSYELVSNRRNFGLRDPIMPIHELVLVAPNQRFGQLIGVMLARVVREYGLDWTAQAPDVDRWVYEPCKARVRGRRWDLRQQAAVTRAQESARGRFSLAILMVHYAKRVPRNSECAAPRDVRRQAAQFQLCRLIVTLANVADTSRCDEIDDVIDLALNAILHISEDAKEVTPHGKSESLWALAATARVLSQAGREAQAYGAIDILAWCTVHTTQISDIRRVAVDENLMLPRMTTRLDARSRYFAKRSARNELPKIGKCDPWV